MSITAELKQISVPTLEILREDPSLIPSFFDAKWLPGSRFWQQAIYWPEELAEETKQQARARFERLLHWQTLEQQFLSEWEAPELDLHKYFPELTYLLAGYIAGAVSSEWTLPELRNLEVRQRQSDFLHFLVVENSKWDDLPLVNAIGAGTEIGSARDYGRVRYLLTNEVGQILNGLILLKRRRISGTLQTRIAESKTFALD